MSEFKQPASKAEFEKNFSQIKPLMNSTQAYYESSRCLFCYDAPCVSACPTHIDIPLFIKQINSGNLHGSAKTIYDSNYLGNACGKVCPTEVLCEGACVYNLQNVKPIEIGRLQNFATSNAIRNEIKYFESGKPNGKKAAVIGAGPAGISCACELRREGFEVDIYEAKDKPSGLALYGVAPYKITNEEALEEINYLQKQFGFRIHYRSYISSKDEFKRLENEFDAVFLGIGLGKTNPVNIKGENLKNCFGAVEYISELRINQHNTKTGNKVIVLGGGNTAMDAASESARLGAGKVILAYRRGKEEMGAYFFEYELAKNSGVEGLFNVSPVEIMGEDKVSGVKFIRTKTTKGKVEVIEGTEFVVDCDLVIKATGQLKQSELFENIEGLETDERGRIKINKENYQTTNPKYFSAGDVISGGQEVVNAVADAKLAAKGIAEYLQ
ncbi:MAG: NAD(P)-dependent oxidoreductase [Bacteroidetes bacterium]|nr:NAD(P)-dependent oxidoreductase [Bacteroidota bacterium]